MLTRRGTATMSITFTDFDMTLPRVGPALSVEGQGTLENDPAQTADPGMTRGKWGRRGRRSVHTPLPRRPSGNRRRGLSQPPADPHVAITCPSGMRPRLSPGRLLG